MCIRATARLPPSRASSRWRISPAACLVKVTAVISSGRTPCSSTSQAMRATSVLVLPVPGPTITAIWKHRRPTLRDEDYYDLFEESAPIDTSSWRTDPKESTHHSTHELHPETEAGTSLMQDDELEESEHT